MNERINFLKFFFDTGKFPDESLTGQIIEFFPALIFVYDLESEKISYCNRRFSNYFGFSAYDFREQPNILETLILDEDWSRVDSELKRFTQLNEDETHSYCCRLTPRHGVAQFHKVSTSVIRRGMNGKASSLLFICQDITRDLKRNGEAQSIRKLFDETEELLQFGTWTLFVDQGVMEWTAGLSALLGYEKNNVIKTQNIFLSHIPGEYRSIFEESIRRSIQTKGDFEIEYPVYPQSGSRKIFFTKGKASCNSKGEVDRLFGITRDVTDLRNSEREQERSIRELNRSNRELEEFAYVASHDLQEPLRKISTFGERLKQKLTGSLDHESELYLSRILAASNSMRGLIDHLLEFSRTNRSSHSFEKVEVRSLIDQVVADMELKIEETRSVIDIAGALPMVDGVTSELKQLFSNLLSNAIKFRKKDSAAHVSISARCLTQAEKRALQLRIDRSYFKIDVTDDGIGFDLEYADKIFLIFQRLNGKSEYPGSGIGLAICKKIVDNHNGIIFAHSEPDNGATFSVVLPEKQL